MASKLLQQINHLCLPMCLFASINAMKQKIGRKTCFINTFHKSRFYCYVCTYRRSHCDLLPRPLGLRSRQDSSDTGRKGGSRYKFPWDTSYSPHCTACIPRGSIQTQRTAETSLQQTRQKIANSIVCHWMIYNSIV